jgi:hypothetical protein
MHRSHLTFMDEYLLLSQVDIEEDDEDDFQTAIACGVVISHGLLEAHRVRIERRRRHYLTRPDLLDNPRGETPWQRLYESRSDRAYITTMSVDVATFDLILDSGFRFAWNNNCIPRADAPGTTTPRIYHRSLDAAGALGLVLHYLNSTMEDISLMQIFALVPATISRYTTFSLEILLSTLRDLKDAQIQWPRDNEFNELNELVLARHPLLTGAFGTMDGLNLPVQKSADEEIENSTYNGWLHSHFVSSVLAFSASGTCQVAHCSIHTTWNKTGVIIGCRLNAPGSWHDARVAQPIYEKLRMSTPEGFYVVTDTAFPRGTDQIHGRIRAPMKEGTRLPADPIVRTETLAYDRQLLSFRQTAEWGNGILQKVFGRLRVPLPINNESRRAFILENCVRLCNLRTRRVGLNQIRTVYMPIWKDNGQEEMWLSFGDMLFSDQRKNDRVHRFHLVEGT